MAPVSSSPKPDVDAMRGGIVAKIVHVAVKIDFLEQSVTCAVENAQSAGAAGDEKFFGVGGVDDSLGARNAGEGAFADACADIDHFHGIVTECGDEEAIFAVEAEMIEAADEAGSGDGFGEDEWAGLLGSRALTERRGGTG